MSGAILPLSPIRAYPVFVRPPEGCLSLLVGDTRHTPHLRPGERAVYDPTDTEIQFGELYVVQQSRGPAIWQVSNEGRGCGGERAAAWLRPLNGPTSYDDAVERMKRGRCHMSDGPIYLDALQGMIVGRVIGVCEPMAGGAR